MEVLPNFGIITAWESLRSVCEIEVLIPIVQDEDSNFTLALNYEKSLAWENLLYGFINNYVDFSSAHDQKYIHTF